MKCALVPIFLLLLTSCSASAPTRYFLIEAVTPEPMELATSPRVELLDVELPQYLERYQIASRRADNQVVFASSNQWGENLRKNLIRAITRNLTNSLGSTAVGSPSLRLTGDVDAYIKISIERFERGPDGYVHLVARWHLLDGANQTLANASTRLSSNRRVDAADYAGTVSELSLLTGQLSVMIAGQVRAQLQ